MCGLDGHLEGLTEFRMLRQVLMQRRAVVLFDGLDEAARVGGRSRSRSWRWSCRKGMSYW